MKKHQFIQSLKEIILDEYKNLNEAKKKKEVKKENLKIDRHLTLNLQRLKLKKVSEFKKKNKFHYLILVIIYYRHFIF